MAQEARQTSFANMEHSSSDAFSNFRKALGMLNIVEVYDGSLAEGHLALADHYFAKVPEPTELTFYSRNMFMDHSE